MLFRGSLLSSTEGYYSVVLLRIVFFFFLGASLASFLKLVKDRFVRKHKLGTSFWRSLCCGRSRCDECGHPLGAIDLIPVISFLLTGGRCRYCGAKLSRKYLYSELALGIIFVLASFFALSFLGWSLVFAFSAALIFSIF